MGHQNRVDLSISFPATFGTIPAVVVTSEWPNGGLGYVETIYHVSGNGFNVHSGNRAANYFVNWTTIGPPVGVAALSHEMEEAVRVFQKLGRDEMPLTKDSAEQGSGETK
jgi:hypothetical protein